MTATNHTEHYELSQYTEDDHPTYTGDYNSDMSKIDAAIHATAQSGGLSKVAHDTTLTGDGTQNAPLGVGSGTAINPTDNKWNTINFNDFCNNGMHTFNGIGTNAPNNTWITGGLIVLRSYRLIMQLCFFNPRIEGKNVAYRQATLLANEPKPSDDSWSAWNLIV
jgi:hypothetical protein